MTAVVEHTEVLLPGPAEAVSALLGVPVPRVEGNGLPLLWHWFYMLDRPAQADLGPDGHPIRNTVPLPPARGRRRMWAGGRVRTLGPLRFGQPATRRTSVLSVTEKQGRSGSLIIMAVLHQVTQSGCLVVDEQQDLVYREAASPGLSPVADAAPIVPAGPDEWSIDIDTTLLFRFSALTYNSNRTHYDRDYARHTEGYPGLLTHGPLQALAMAEATRAQGHEGNQLFEYRLIAPLFDHQGLVVSVETGPDSTTASVRDLHGRRTATSRLRRLDR